MCLECVELAVANSDHKLLRTKFVVGSKEKKIGQVFKVNALMNKVS